jgi:peptidylprolyl isomerase
MALQKGDFIITSYVAKVKETNEVFDTTDEAVAKKEHLFKEGDIYEPKLTIVGEGWLLKPLDEALLTMEVAKPCTVEITADKAFGARDPEKIKRVSIKQLYEKQINPEVGARIEFQGKNATIRAVGAGRVLLDFNPPLAGRTLIYDITVTKVLAKKEEKLSALIHRRVPVVEEEKFKLKVKDCTLSVDMPEDTFYIEGIQIAKRGIALDIQKYTDVNEIQFVETYKSEPKPMAVAAKAEEKPAKAEEKPAEAKPAAEAKPKEAKPKAAKPKVAKE